MQLNGPGLLVLTMASQSPSYDTHDPTSRNRLGMHVAPWLEAAGAHCCLDITPSLRHHRCLTDEGCCT